MESQAAQKLERQLVPSVPAGPPHRRASEMCTHPLAQAKVERKRSMLQLATVLQMCMGPPFTWWVLTVNADEPRSALAATAAGLGVLWALVGSLGLYAMTRKRVQVRCMLLSLDTPHV